MKKVSIRSADGAIRTLALVRQTGATIYLCPISRYSEVVAGDEDSVVGFPATDISPSPDLEPAHG